MAEFGSNNLGTGDAGDLSFIESLTNCNNLRIMALNDNGFGGVYQIPLPISQLN